MNRLTKCDQVPVRRKYQQLPLSVALVDRPVDIAAGQGIEFWFEFREEEVDIMDIDVVGKASIAGRGSVIAGLLEQAEGHTFALQICVV